MPIDKVFEHGGLAHENPFDGDAGWCGEGVGCPAIHADIPDFRARVLAIIPNVCPECKLELVGLTSCQSCQSCQSCRELLSERRPP